MLPKSQRSTLLRWPPYSWLLAIDVPKHDQPYAPADWGHGPPSDGIAKSPRPTGKKRPNRNSRGGLAEVAVSNESLELRMQWLAHARLAIAATFHKIGGSLRRTS